MLCPVLALTLLGVSSPSNGPCSPIAPILGTPTPGDEARDVGPDTGVAYRITPSLLLAELEAVEGKE